MANDTPNDSPEVGPSTSFISQSASKVDTVYSDFFQETSDGKISVGSKAKKSGLEIFTTFLSYVIPVSIVVVALASGHVFLRNQESGSFAENYPFLCPYMNYGVNLESSDRGCKTVSSIQSAYTEKQNELESEIVKRLNEYIPIKITKNLMDTSPEKIFILKTYQDKIQVDTIMNRFQEVLDSAQFAQEDNIKCSSLTIDAAGVLSTQCTVSGKEIGEDGTNGRVGSARIEALKFIDILSNTNKSNFILMNPPTSLSIEDISQLEDRGIFTTRTTLPIQAQYVLSPSIP